MRLCFLRDRCRETTWPSSADVTAWGGAPWARSRESLEGAGRLASVSSRPLHPCPCPPAVVTDGPAYRCGGGGAGRRVALRACSPDRHLRWMGLVMVAGCVAKQPLQGGARGVERRVGSVAASMQAGGGSVSLVGRAGFGVCLGPSGLAVRQAGPSATPMLTLASHSADGPGAARTRRNPTLSGRKGAGTWPGPCRC